MQSETYCDKKLVALMFLIAAICMVLWIVLPGDALASDTFRTGGVNFRLKDSYSLADVDSLVGYYKIALDDSVSQRQMYFGSIPDSIPVDTVVSAFSLQSAVLWVEPDYLIQEATNDPLYEQEWYLEHSGAGGNPWADVSADLAWPIDTGSCDIRVGIIDSGIPFDPQTGLLTHEDLRNDEGTCSIIVRRIASDPDQDMNDETGHGTHVAGVLGARTNNNLGIAGIARGVTMVIYKYPVLWVSRVVPRIYDAIDPLGGDVDILSLSWNVWEGDINAVHVAMVDAWISGVLVVVAAGNRSGPTLDDDPQFPCAYSDELDNILCVGGTDRFDLYWICGVHCGALNYPQINISAPASSFTVPNIGGSDSYASGWYGTSGATPLVAGVAALVLSQARESEIQLSASETRDILTASADDCNWDIGHLGRDDSLGFGRVNAFKALLRTPGRKELESDLTIPPHHYDAVSPYVLVDQLVVPSGLALTFEPGTRLLFAPGASLVVEGQIVAEGTSQDPIVFDCSDENEAWRGIFVNSADNAFEYCEFRNSQAAIRVLSQASAELTDCEFNDCGIAVYSNNGTVTMDGCTVNEGSYGVFAVNYSILSLDNCLVSGAGRAGVWALISNAGMDECTFSENGGEIGETYFEGGIRNTFSALRLHCVTSSENYGPGLSALGGYTRMGWATSVWGKNTIQDNLAPSGFSGAQIYFENAQFEMCNGRNKICKEDSWSILDATPTTHDVNYNYWCEDVALPQDYMIGDEDPASDDERCRLSDKDFCLETAAAELFQQAWEEENTTLYQEAYDDYTYVLETYPESKEAELCPDRILACKYRMEENWSEQRAYFKSVADTTKDEGLEFECRASAAWCLVELDSVEYAEDEFKDMLDYADDDYQYMRASLAALMLELTDAPWDTLGILDSAPSEDHLFTVLDQMESVLKGKNHPKPTVTVPSRYQLYQNYPNPFNPVTAIRFDLPERGNVVLKVFDILGREVAVLTNQSYEAGTHEIRFDGSNLASGVYIYSLRASGFHADRKMLLLK